MESQRIQFERIQFERIQFERILVRAPNWVGDAVLSMPAMEQIRLRFPGARVCVLAPPPVAELYAPPLVDEIVEYRVGSGWAAWRLAAQLRARRFDAAILMQNGRDTAVCACLARIPVRIGYDRAKRGWWLTHRIAEPRGGERGHQRDYYLELLRRAGLIDTLPEAREVKLSARGGRSLEGAFLKGTWIGVAPGSANGSAKRWLPERFAEAAAMTAGRMGARVAVFGVAAERDLCERVAQMIRAQGVEAVNFAGETTTADFIAMAASCAVMLANDSGAMHVASALGVPTVAVFGPTDARATGPVGVLARVVRQAVDCSPCLLHECPTDHRCMTAVSAARVAEEVAGLLRL